ncbi:MAG TPA: TIGR03767 family metallophosphoesterase, partial [Dehalococcoidia bacterium]|nr:TIGR03767 family metallophosphoesterase [Dehalococcoidia bacterium]
KKDRRSRRTLSRRRFLQNAGILGAGILAAAACGSDEEGRTGSTLDRTIVRDQQGNFLEGPGEPYSVRTELAQAKAGREARQRSLLTFHHFTDFRITDEESPLRSEWVEGCASPISTSAFRPQESLSLQAASALISQANRIQVSPATGRPVDFAVHTGNAADNAQYNELRWFLDLMDGKSVLPDSGTPGYQGVQKESPASAYPDLLADAQREFRPEPLRYPWYTVLGNHDVLAQGSVVPSDSVKAIALGSEKVLTVGGKARDEICDDPSSLLAPGSSDKILSDPDTVVAEVSPDPLRRLLSRKEWVEEHFKTNDAPGPSGHGLSQQNQSDGTAFYAMDFGRLSLIVLDTVNPGGFSSGSIDEAQFRWLEDQLRGRSSAFFDAAGLPQTAANEDRLIVVASNHGIDALNNPFPDPATNAGRFRGPQLETMLHRFPNVVLHITGYALQHRLTPRPDPDDPGRGYWEVCTGSPLDYPMQGRLLDIIDNGDGTISIFSTVYDTAAALHPGDSRDPTPDDKVNQLDLASIARQVGMKDPQLDLEAGGLGGSDRNAELLLRAPFDLEATQTRTPPAPSPNPSPAA